MVDPSLKPGVGFALAGVEPLLAEWTLKADGPAEVVFLQNRLDALGEAWLADVVVRLRDMSRIAGGELYLRVDAKHKGPIGNLDQRVATAIRKFLLQFSQSVCHAEVLLLESLELGVVSEETVLRLEQLVVDRRNRGGEGIEVAQRQGGLADIPGSANGRSGCGEQ